ncbi:MULTISPECIES: hypothetical protein [unclassified Pseudoalteromonas]|uniref:hypothetical protein n=1 Tax=unclassified Pseudoalteromonas TaxID=194690 RepID=UPI0007309924|nr:MULTISPECIES: hypothetical protein [unclassified Pseudoalteromonas]KTD91638.1 hypothetical protein ATS71_18305 [Pseudoalteromonas sp. H71]MBW4967000.1 hypothetical protein [Pseudoalteromonas sp. CR1]TMN81690.1 hypothetical protein CWB64_10175 [Pseudoalteromonas sp. S410]TMN91851.1 hypothetical protein CWB62_03940 [Pseudoalteromonas sp. S408]TMN96140.1 hypothetical protein CWB63_16375 [Pseudoalteromonas sp. S409]|tara:strand:+ start:23 stop:529 length:507 start_codon:yes stop_codon:yes gene_type:complete
MQQRKKFKNPYIGISKEDFVELSGSKKELLTAEIELADSKGESLAYFRIDGDFFYDDIYYSADILVPKTHWLDSRDENQKKLWIAVIYNVPYGEYLDAEFDFNKIEDPNFGVVKPVLVSELNKSELAYEKVKRLEMFANIEKAATEDKLLQAEKDLILTKLLSKVTKH